MTMDLVSAARNAATKHSTNITFATIEYAQLTEQMELAGTDQGRKKLQDEMLSVLPPYRHPTNNELAEYMIYFNPECLVMTGAMYRDPDFIGDLIKGGVRAETLSAVKEYVRASELRIIELAQCREELDELKAKFTEARLIYDENREKRSDIRNALVIQSIGLSTGFAPKRVNEKKVYIEYVKLVRKEGLPRNEAVEQVRRAYELSSHGSVCQVLYAYRKSLFEKWEKQSPSLLPEIKNRLKRLIPQKDQ